MRTIIVGDIHGCYDEWQNLLQKANFDSKQDCLILLGDLMDRGKNSYEVFCKAVSLQQEMGDRFVVLRGSHEKMLLDNSPKLKDRLLWNLIGKRATVKSFRYHDKNMLDSKGWFEKNSILYYEADNFQCVHAAIKEEPLADNDIHTLLMDHRLTLKNLYRGKLTVTGHIHLKKPMWFDGSGGKGCSLSYHQWAKLPQGGVICIDTGCAEGNRLTAMIIHGEKYYLEYV